MSSTSSLETKLRRVGVICFAIVATVCGLVMLAWKLGQPQMGAFDIAYSTIVLLFGLSVAACLCRYESNWTVQWLGLVIGWGALTMNLLVCAHFVSSYKWPGEEWLAHQLAGGDEINRVFMSKTAAYELLLAHLAWLVQCHPWVRRWWWARQAGAILGLIVAILGLVLLLCYLLQSAFYAPMAFLTTVCSLLMGSGFLLTAGVDSWPMNQFFPSPKEGSLERRFIWGLASLAFLLAITVAATGRFYFRSQQINGRKTAWEALTTIADLKVAQIKAWRNERLADANYLYYTPYPVRRALDFLQEPHGQHTETVFRSWLTTLLVKGQVESALLLDEQLNVRLVHPKKFSKTLSPAARRAAEEAAKTKRVVVADLYHADTNGPVQFGMAVPLVIRHEGDRHLIPSTGRILSEEDQTKAVIILQINAEQTLFPMVGSWPTPSPTSEAQLVRREGDDVVFLNALRHSTNAPMTLRKRIDRRWLAVRSVLREGKGKGRVTGQDYNRAEAFGVWRAIPDTSWYLIAKVDQEEIFDPLHRQAWTTAMLVGVLIAAAMLGVGLLGRQRHLTLMRRELQLERQHREAEQKFRTLFESSRDAITLVDGGAFVDCNQAALDLFGCVSRDQFLTKKPSDFSPPRQADGMDSRTAAEERIGAAQTKGIQFFEWQHRRLNGTVFPAEVLLSRIELNGRTIIQGVIRDITERKRAETSLLEISDREQARIGHDLHDGLCQHLVVTAFAANTLKEKLVERNLPETHDASQIATLLDDAITQARNTARGLFPVRLEAEGLASALQELAARINQLNTVQCRFECLAPVFISDNTSATHLYRIAQEAVNNALKHGQPKHIALRLVRREDQIELAILDDGIGIPDPLPSNRGMGLNIMSYRAKTIGGTLRISRRKKGGTEVSCTILDNGSSLAAAKSE